MRSVIKAIVLALTGAHIMLASHANYAEANRLRDMKLLPGEEGLKVDADVHDKLVYEASGTFASGVILCLLAIAPAVVKIVQSLLCRR